MTDSTHDDSIATSGSDGAFDAVAGGPGASDTADPVPGPTPDEGVTHPSITALRAEFGDDILRHELHAGDQHVVFVEPTELRPVLTFLKQDPEQHYEFLLDVTAVDYGGGLPIQVVYQLWSLAHHRMLRVKVELPLNALRVASVQPLWETADWLEREVYDMFGVTFEGHPDLRRILMPEHYAEGHPLRKDFPLRGRFSRAEQTRRALSQEVEDSYIPLEMQIGRDPQIGGSGADEASGSDATDSPA